MLNLKINELRSIAKRTNMDGQTLCPKTIRGSIH